MDMSLVGAIMAQTSATTQAQIGASMMKKVLDTTQDVASQLIAAMSGVMSGGSMENSVTPWKGANVDIKA